MRFTPSLTLAGAGIFFAAHTTAVLAAQDPITTQRLAGMIQVWGEVKYFHPALAYPARPDWDTALIETVPRVMNARSAEDYRAALRSMLERVHDPLTRVQPAAIAPQSAPSVFDVALAADGVLTLQVGSYYSLFDPEVHRKLGLFAELLPTARSIVVDLRSPGPIDAYGQAQMQGVLAGIERLLVPDSAITPGIRRRVYAGYPGNSAFSSGQYRSGVYTEDGRHVRSAAGARRLPLVFRLNANSGILPVAHALVAAGKASFQFDGDPQQHNIGEVRHIDAGDGVVVQIRSAQLISAQGHAVDFTVNDLMPRVPAVATPLAERSYRDMRYPSLEYRVLALARSWNIIQHFYPYLALLDTSWPSLLPHFIPRFVEARDAREYALAVAGVARSIHDSHAYVAGGAYDELVPNGYPPLRVRIIEGKPVVTALYEANPDIRVGDVVEKVDGVVANVLIARVGQLVSASTPQGARDKAALSFMNGAPGSAAVLTIRDAAGNTRAVRIVRRKEDYLTLFHRERSGPVIRLLEGTSATWTSIGWNTIRSIPSLPVSAVRAPSSSTCAVIRRA